ncbi:HAD family hydrolase [Thioclava sp. BHET1]|nr:HAD family hydrolase [Thioclava sp. BHET1]
MGDIGLVIFDCDGVLIDSEVISCSLLIKELRPYGVEIDMPFVQRHFLGRAYPVMLREVRERFGVILPEAFEIEYRRALLAAFADHLEIVPGVREVLSRLGVACCVATSSSPERVRQSLMLTGLDDIFAGRVYTSSMVARGKPAPDLFLHAAAEMGVDPTACVVIEDSANGLRAARAAGMEVWHFTGGSHLRDMPRDLVAEFDLPEVHPDRRFARFSEFFSLRPELARQSDGAMI